MNHHASKKKNRQYSGVNRIEEKKCRIAQIRSATYSFQERWSNNGQIGEDVCRDGYSPVRKLVPGKEVAGKVCRTDKDKHGQTDEPVPCARSTVGLVIKNAKHMEKADSYKEMTGPVMKVAEQWSEKHIFPYVLDRKVRLYRTWFVGEA